MSDANHASNLWLYLSRQTFIAVFFLLVFLNSSREFKLTVKFTFLRFLSFFDYGQLAFVFCILVWIMLGMSSLLLMSHMEWNLYWYWNKCFDTTISWCLIDFITKICCWFKLSHAKLIFCTNVSRINSFHFDWPIWIVTNPHQQSLWCTIDCAQFWLITETYSTLLYIK